MFATRASVLGPNNANCRAWCAAVYANGGSVSLVHQEDMALFFGLEEAAGIYALCDDMWWLGGENPIQVRTSLKQRRLGTFVNSPVVSPRRHTQFDGATSYFNTGFIPSTHAAQATYQNLRVGVYDRVNNTSTGYIFAATSNGNRGNYVRGRLASPNTIGSYGGNATQMQATLNPASDNRGLQAVSRNGPNTTDVLGYHRGNALTVTLVPTAVQTVNTLAGQPMYFGCLNNIGTPASFRSCSVMFGWFGAQLSASQEAKQSANLQQVGGRMGAAV
jgi:hypothetical protein